MNYESKSDFEINSAVTAKLNNCESWEVNGAEFYHCGVDGSAYHSIPILNYCNNPDDACPIIFENGICLTSPTIGRKHVLWSASWNECGGKWSNGDLKHGDKNPLRAAMIVFLMTNE